MKEIGLGFPLLEIFINFHHSGNFTDGLLRGLVHFGEGLLLVGLKCSPEIFDDIKKDFEAFNSVDVVDLTFTVLLGKQFYSLSVYGFPSDHPVDIGIGITNFLKFVLDILLSVLALRRLL